MIPLLDAAEKFLDYNVYKLMETTGAKKVYKGLCVCTAKERQKRGQTTKTFTVLHLEREKLLQIVLPSI